ncbi:MAG: Serine/threonine-protein kinase PknB [candidate division BRC1 bacterium ADurb.BinA292]|nr:MAG: Serine/threonine-protein kinase PknB [candidate division BRC1 bacterium ADurb.BinA292]
MILQPGQSIADGLYEIESFIAHGGMAEVWRVIHKPTGQIQALKILKKKSLRFPDLLERFRLEYDMLKRLNHPHIMKAYEFGQFNYMGSQLPWFTMEYFTNNMRQRLQQISIGEGLNLLLPVLEALDYAHQQNICHRDLKPMNILLNDQGRAVLTDFGIAKETDRDRGLTGRNIIGTAYYISPEQCMGLKVTPQSDIYAFGVILYQLCTGHFPFEDASEVSIIRRHINETPRSVQEINPAISPTLALAIAKCLEKKPEDRWGSARELAQALRKADEIAETAQHVLRRGQLFHNRRFKVIGLIDMGGFAEVYRVRNLENGRLHALKICLPALAYDSEMLKRFQREITILRAFNHERIIRVVEWGEYEYENLKLPYFIMPFYPGNLGACMSQPVDPEKAFQILMDVLEALAYAHSFEGTGVLHRDLKPSNILIDTEGRGYLTDFGIAKISKGVSTLMTRSATMTRAAVGTSYYMSPEQIRNEPVDARADIYSFGIILYEVAAGRRPYDAKSSEHIIAMHLFEKPDPPRKYNLLISPRLQSVILKCLEKNPDDRFPSVPDLIEALKKTQRRGKFFAYGGAADTGTISRIRKPMRRAGRSLRRAAFSPRTWLILAGVVGGVLLGWGGAVAARMQVSGNPSVSQILSPRALSYDGTIRPARRMAAVFDGLGGAAAGAAAGQWEEPVEVAFLDTAARQRYDELKRFREEAAAAGEITDALRAEGRMRSLAAAAAPTVAVRNPDEIIPTNQGAADAVMELALSRAVDLPLQYEYRLIDQASNEVVKEGTSPTPQIQLAAVPAGSYTFEARAVHQGFRTPPAQSSLEIRNVEKPIRLALQGEGDQRTVVFTNFDEGFRSYEWQVRDAAGQVVPLPPDTANQPFDVALLTQDGRYQVSVLAYDQDPSIVNPYPSLPESVIVDRTAPQLTMTAQRGPERLGAVQPGQTFVLMPGDDPITLGFAPSDNIAAANEIRVLDAEGGQPATVLAYNPDRSTYAFVVEDPYGNRSQPFEIRVQSVGQEMAALAGQWSEAQTRLNADATRYARTRALFDPGPLAQAVSGGSISREWLAAQDESAMEQLQQKLDELEDLMERDDAFAELADLLAAVAAQLPAAQQGPLNAALRQARQSWATDVAAADLEPTQLLREAARAGLPAVTREMLAYAPAGDTGAWRLELSGAAPRLPNGRYRYSLAQEDPGSADAAQLLSGNTTSEADISVEVARPDQPVNLAAQFVIDAGEPLGNLAGPPSLIHFDPAVQIDDQLRADMDNYEALFQRLARDEARYARTLAWLQQPGRLSLVDRSGNFDFAWTLRNANDPAQIQQMREQLQTLQQMAAQDDAFAEALENVDLAGWSARHRNALADTLRDAWMKGGAQDVAAWIGAQRNEYAARNADTLLAPPEVDWDAISVELAEKIVRIERRAFGKPPTDSASLKLGWTTGDSAPASTFDLTGDSTTAEPPQLGREYRLAARWVSGDYASDWAIGGRYEIPDATPTPTPTPSPTATPTPTPQPTATAAPAPTPTPRPTAEPTPTATPEPTQTPAATGAVTRAEADALAKRITSAIRNVGESAGKDVGSIFQNFRRLHANPDEDSIFIKNYDKGDFRDSLANKYVGFMGARVKENPSGNTVLLEVIMQLISQGGRQQPILFELTVRRDNDGNLIIVSDRLARTE